MIKKLQIEPSATFRVSHVHSGKHTSISYTCLNLQGAGAYPSTHWERGGVQPFTQTFYSFGRYRVSTVVQLTRTPWSVEKVILCFISVDLGQFVETCFPFIKILFSVNPPKM